MKHLNWLSFALAIFFCFAIAAPMNVDAAPAVKSRAEAKKSPVKKVSAKAAKKQESKKSAAKRDNDKKLHAAKAVKNAVKSEKNAKNAERAVWLKRARDSELLSGKASWYGKDFHNKATASGLKYDMYTFTAAHRTLPLGTVVKVTDQHNGKSVMVCVTDRGPYVRGRVIDVSYAAAKKLDMRDRGIAPVKLEVVSDEKGAPLKSGQAYFVSYGSRQGKSKVGPFDAFADAAAMHEALRQAHPEAEVILDKTSRP